jgi:hypothetical protein
MARSLAGTLTALCLALSTASASAQPAAPAPGLRAALLATRQPVIPDDGGFTGTGAEAIRDAVAAARYVSIGEDHFTREIPRFTRWLCRQMAPQGLAAYVVEAGPIATERVAAMLVMPDRVEKMAAFAKAYPNAVAFLDGDEENEAAAECRSRGAVRIVGIDQEFLGASGLLLDEALQGKPSAAARRELIALRAMEKRDSAAAAADGDPSKLFMLKAEAPPLERVEALLGSSGAAQAREALRALQVSRDIYATGRTEGSRSNRMRSLLMKRHLAQMLPAKGKVLLKFGDWHLYKGVNPLGQLDIGNFISERADGDGEQSLHILVLGAGGSHGSFGGYGRQARPVTFVQSEDKDYGWFALAADNRLKEGWTLYDLRKLRHRRIADVDADWRRVIDGYDLLIVIPEGSAAKLIGYSG